MGCEKIKKIIRVSIRNYLRIQQIRDNIDVIVAIIGACIFLLASLIVFKTNFQLGFAPFSALIACILYLIQSTFKNINDDFGFSTRVANSCNIYILLIYLLLFAAGLILILSYSQYQRPLLYFIILSISGGLISFCALYFSLNQFQRYLILFAIFIISIHLYIAPQLLYTDLIGIDPWKHESFVTSSIQSSHFVEGFAYSRMPGMHSLIAVASLIFNANYKTATLISVSFSQSINLVFIYLLAKNILNESIGVLATLLFAVSPNKISLGFWVHPTTFSLIIAMSLLYLVFIGGNKPNVPNNVLKLVLGILLIATHMQIALGMAFVLFTVYISTPLYAMLFKYKNSILNFQFVVLFIIIMLSWWMYVSNHFNIFVNLFHMVSDFDSSSVASTTVYAKSSTNLEYVIDMSPYLIYYCLSIVGMLFSISKKSNISYFALSLSGLTIISIPFVLILTSLGGLLGERWIYFSQMLMTIPAAVGVCLIFHLRKLHVIKPVLVVFISLFIFVSIINPSANVDNIFNRDSFVCPAHTDSELAASSTLGKVTSNEVFTDAVYQFPIIKYSNVDVNPIEPLLLDNNFSLASNELIVIRKEVLIRRSLKLPQRLSPEVVSTLSCFNRIYDDDAVVFYKNPLHFID